MTAQIPVKAVKSGGNVTALAEMAPGDTLDPGYIPSGVFATAAQGAKADSAVQPAALAVVQTTVPATPVTANYTLSNADAGTEVQVNSAVGVTVTVPATGITASSVVLVRQVGAGQVTIAGSTVKSFAATTKLAGQNALAVVRIDSSTAAYVSGELAAS